MRGADRGVARAAHCSSESPPVEDGGFRRKITDMYNRFSPEKLERLPEILLKYKDNLQELYEALLLKYQPSRPGARYGKQT